MLKNMVLAVVCAAIFFCFPCPAAAADSADPAGLADLADETRIPAYPDEAAMADDAFCLAQAYPDFVQGLQHEGARIWLVLKDGRRLIYADERKPFLDKDGTLANASISQSMALPYAAGPQRRAPNVDAGRIRSQEWLDALYGRTDKELLLSTIQMGKSPVRVSSRQGAAEAFRRVAAGLERLQADPALAVYIQPIGGFFRRAIAGSTRPSPHSYGIAIDLNPDRGPYWRWQKQSPHPDQFTYPEALVALFEANGFIWGGKWKHYDLMHFEYRPELLCKARLQRERLEKVQQAR